MLSAIWYVSLELRKTVSHVCMTGSIFSSRCAEDGSDIIYANEWEQYSTVLSVRTPVQTVIGSKEGYLVINWNLTGMFWCQVEELAVLKTPTESTSCTLCCR